MKYIEIKGKQFPCRITMGAMLRFKNETGRDVSQMDEDNLSDLVILVWCCVSSASKADGVEFDMGLMDFADQLSPEVITSYYDSIEEGEKKTEVKSKKQKRS